jgi:hypothetical protein
MTNTDVFRDFFDAVRRIVADKEAFQMHRVRVVCRSSQHDSARTIGNHPNAPPNRGRHNNVGDVPFGSREQPRFSSGASKKTTIHDSPCFSYCPLRIQETELSTELVPSMMCEYLISSARRPQHDIYPAIEDNKHVTIAVTLGLQGHVPWHELFSAIAMQSVNYFVSESLKRKIPTKIRVVIV